MWLCNRDWSKECKGGYRDCTDCVIDNIKAEIEEQKKGRCFDDDDMVIYQTGLEDAFCIVDKYRQKVR